MLAAHIIATRVYWFHSLMKEGEPALKPLLSWDNENAPRRGAAELVDGLEATWRLIGSCLDRWTPAMLDDTFTSRRGRKLTRQCVLWHVMETQLPAATRQRRSRTCSDPGNSMGECWL